MRAPPPPRVLAAGLRHRRRGATTSCSSTTTRRCPATTTSWHLLKHEIRRKRNAGRKRRWRVRNQGTNEGYILVPGTHDGEADSYGVGDFWALRYRSGQLDDSAVATDTRAHIDSFVNHESIVGTNVVVWYAAHFSHDAAHEHDPHGDSHIVGPTLRPDRW